MVVTDGRRPDVEGDDWQCCFSIYIVFPGLSLKCWYMFNMLSMCIIILMMNFFQKKKFNYLCSGCFDRIPQTGWLMKNGNLSPTVWRLEVPDQAWRIRCHGGLTSWLITSAFPLCLPVGEGTGSSGVGALLLQGPSSPFRRALPLWPHHRSTPSHWRLRLNTWI